MQSRPCCDDRSVILPRGIANLKKTSGSVQPAHVALLNIKSPFLRYRGGSGHMPYPTGTAILLAGGFRAGLSWACNIIMRESRGTKTTHEASGEKHMKRKLLGLVFATTVAFAVPAQAA